MEGQKTELKIIRMSEVESQEVKWLSVYTIWEADNYSGRSG